MESPENFGDTSEEMTDMEEKWEGKKIKTQRIK